MPYKKVFFTMPDDELKRLEKLREKLGVSSLAAALRMSANLLHSMQVQKESGFSTVLVENPRNGKKKELYWG